VEYPEEWTFIDRCPDCNCAIFGMQDEVRFTGPAECNCWLPREEDEILQSDRNPREICQS